MASNLVSVMKPAMLQDVEFTTQLLVVLLVLLVMTAISSGLVGVLLQQCFWVPLWERLMEKIKALLPGMSAYGGSPAYAMVGMAAVLARAKAP